MASRTLGSRWSFRSRGSAGEAGGCFNRPPLPPSFCFTALSRTAGQTVAAQTPKIMPTLEDNQMKRLLELLHRQWSIISSAIRRSVCGRCRVPPSLLCGSSQRRRIGALQSSDAYHRQHQTGWEGLGALPLAIAARDLSQSTTKRNRWCEIQTIAATAPASERSPCRTARISLFGDEVEKSASMSRAIASSEVFYHSRAISGCC